MDRALHDRLAQLAQGAQPALLLRLLVGEVEVQQHEDAGLGVDPATLRPAWEATVERVLTEATLEVPTDAGSCRETLSRTAAAVGGELDAGLDALGDAV